MFVYGLTIFLSAFLLFQVQPMVAKYILPWFGGGPGVWTTCMLFFQMVLLAGYGYAHFLSSRFSPKKQARIHLSILAVAVLCLIQFSMMDLWKPSRSDYPIVRILSLLFLTIGLPYFAVSTTGPLLQAWYSWTFASKSPYRLYALSNLGSFLALLTYPFLVEPNIWLHSQTIFWSAGFALFAALCAMLAIRLSALASERGATEPISHSVSTKEDQNDPDAPTIVKYLLWLGLSACGSTLLLATTNQMCQDVAVIPFLWIVPLALYLLSFILCFDSDWWYLRALWLPCFFICCIISAVTLLRGVSLGIILQVIFYSFTLFTYCMVCHGELAKLKPKPRYLTSFFLTISAGGALGGVFVGIIAPTYFLGFWEYQLGLIVCAGLVIIVTFGDSKTWIYRYQATWGGLAVLIVEAYSILIAVLFVQMRSVAEDALAVTRNFYGVLRVEEYGEEGDDWHRYTLNHGRINHGTQYQSPQRRRDKTSYYGPHSGMGVGYSFHPRNLNRDPSGSNGMTVGVVGLGTGSSAAYAQKGDRFRFYDINPAVIRWSDGPEEVRFFTYLADARAAGAKVDVVLGDARISMENELKNGEPQQFDLLAIDAFSSDAIPVHLLTREAFQVYWKHLKPDGILAVHVSNRYLDLEPVVIGLSEEINKKAILVENSDDDDAGVDASTWVLVTSNEEFISSPDSASHFDEWPKETKKVVWTDDFTNLVQVLKEAEFKHLGQDLIDEIQELPAVIKRLRRR